LILFILHKEDINKLLFKTLIRQNKLQWSREALV